MSQIFDRLNNLFRSYTTGNDSDDFDFDSGNDDFGDSDFDEAMRELDDMLNEEKKQNRSSSSYNTYREEPRQQKPAAPEAVLSAAKLLEVDIHDSFENIRKKYKKKLVANHPDRFASDPEAFKKATEITKHINQAFMIIEKYKSK